MAIIQGMAAGRPFLSTPVGGLVNMVEGPLLSNQNGCRWFENGILADASPEAFANGISAARDCVKGDGMPVISRRVIRPEALLIT